MSKEHRLFIEYMKLSGEKLKLMGDNVEGTLTQSKIDKFDKRVKKLQREAAALEAKEYERRKKERERREKGGCFISTTVMTTLGHEDDCAELTLLRNFRDRILLPNPEGRRMVEIYYAISPGLTGILAEESAQNPGVHQDLFTQFLNPVLSLIRSGQSMRAIELYGEMLRAICALPQESPESHRIRCRNAKGWYSSHFLRSVVLFESKMPPNPSPAADGRDRR